jgi:transposase
VRAVAEGLWLWRVLGSVRPRSTLIRVAPRLVKKRKQGRDYWYLVESARVDGKPRVVWQRYLGPAERVAELLQARHEPLEARRRFVGPLALWALAERLGIREALDDVAPKRRQGLSVGQAIQLIAVNRAHRPCSKTRVCGWFGETALARTLALKAEQLRVQRLWDAMDRLTEERIERAEQRLARRLVSDFGVRAELLCFDPTNLFTYLDSDTDSELARRGHSKQRRHDLRQVALALLVTRDHQLPLFHETYAGDRPDAPTLRSLSGRLERRAEAIGAGEPTLVFDRGCWSAQLADELADGSYRFVAALQASCYPRLLAIPARRFRALEGIEGTSAHRTRGKVSGTERTLLLVHSREFERTQRRGFAQTLDKARRQLREIKGVLERGRGRRTRAQLDEKVAEILAPRWVARVLEVELEGDEAALGLRYSTNRAELRRLERELFGKTLLVTDRDDWSDEEIVSAYRAQNHTEQAFRQLKDPEFLAARPIFHWTDQKIRVHLFCCVLALMLQNLLWREAEQAGIETSPKRLLRELRELCEVELIYAPAGGGAGRPRVVRKLATPASALAQQIAETLDFGEPLPA